MTELHREPGHEPPSATEVLLVSTDEDVRTIFPTMLRHAGHRVRVIDDPDAAVTDAVAAPPALVITSYPLHTSAGPTVTEALRHDARTRELPILNVTSRTSAPDLDSARSAGVTHSLTMPVDLSTLVQAVRSLIARD